MKEKIIGIYKIKCLKNNKVYIGQSVNIMQRWYVHKTKLRANKHDNIYLQNAWNKYGERNFEFSIIERCKKEELDSKEEYYIKYYNSFNTDYGFNMTLGGRNNYRYNIQDGEIIEPNHTFENKKRNVLQFDLSGNLVKRWHGVNTIFKSNPTFSPTPLRRCLRMEKGCYTYKNYYWMYEDYYSKDHLLLLMNNKKDSIQYNRELSSELASNLNKEKQKSISYNQYDKEYNFIKRWNSQSELERHGFYSKTLKKRIKDKALYNGYYFTEAS